MFRIFFGNPNTANVTKGLTGVAAVCAVGTLGLAISFGSIDQRSRESRIGPRPFSPAAILQLRSRDTGNRLSQSPGETIGITGVSATGAAGNVAEGLTYPLTGNAATGSVGSVVTDISQSAALTGVAGTGSVGTLAADLTMALSGTQATGAVGSTSYQPVAELTGVQGTGAVGLVVMSGGQSQSGPIGSLTIVGTYVTSQDLIGTVDG